MNYVTGDTFLPKNKVAKQGIFDGFAMMDPNLGQCPI